MRSPWSALSRALIVMVALTRAVYAQTCGDADGNGVVTVTDGVLVLRAAAQLSSACSIEVCDVDRNGVLSVTDGVDVLRAAAALPNPCSPAPNGTPGPGILTPTPTPTRGVNDPDFIRDVVGGVRESAGTSQGSVDGTLEIGLAPVPQPGAPLTLGDLGSGTTAVAGLTRSFTVRFDVGTDGALSSNEESPSLIVAASRADGSPVEEFFRLPLNKTAGGVFLGVQFPEMLANASFSLKAATQFHGVVSQYVSRDLTPTLTATSSTLAFRGGTLTGTLLGTAFTFDPVQDPGILSFLEVIGPPTWNDGNRLIFSLYQPPGTNPRRSIVWNVFVPPVTGSYSARGLVGDTVFTGATFVDAENQMPSPTITDVQPTSSAVTVHWDAPISARSFLVRINVVPFVDSSSIEGERVVSGDLRAATIDGLFLVSGNQYQAALFAFAEDVAGENPSTGPFNMGGYTLPFTAP